MTENISTFHYMKKLLGMLITVTFVNVDIIMQNSCKCSSYLANRMGIHVT